MLAIHEVRSEQLPPAGSALRVVNRLSLLLTLNRAAQLALAGEVSRVLELPLLS
jgi:hypothetical protein